MTKRTTIVVGVLVVVAVLFFVQDGKKPGSTSSSSGGCQVQVTADVLNVRSAPDGTAKVVRTLRTGQVQGATTTVQNDFRELASGQWASDQFLKKLSSSC